MATENEQRAMNRFARLIPLNPEESESFTRATIGVAYWLDCSPHEQSPEDAVAMAKFIRLIAPRIGLPLECPKCGNDLDTMYGSHVCGAKPEIDDHPF